VISFYEAVAPAAQQPVQQAPGAVVPQVQPQQQPQPAQVPAQPVANAGQINSNGQPVEPGWKKGLKLAALVGAGLGTGALIHAGYNYAQDHPGGFWGGASFLNFGSDKTETGSAEPIDVPEPQDKPAKSTRSTGLINANYTPLSRGAPPLDHQWGASGRIGNGGGTYFRHMPANQPFESASLVKVLGQDGRLHYAQRGYMDNSYPIETVDEIGHAPQVNVVKSNVRNGHYHTIPSNPIAKDGMY